MALQNLQDPASHGTQNLTTVAGENEMEGKGLRRGVNLRVNKKICIY